MSRILGRDDLLYRAAAVSGGFAVNNPDQHLRAWFDRRGVVIRSGRASLALSVSAYGFGDHWDAVGIASPRAQANRVVFHRGALDEWYANGPLGVEQGFTIAAAPAGRSARPLTLALAISGNVRPALSHRADAVTFGGHGVSLAYRGLTATDARGRQLPARIELRGGMMLLRIDARDARYPLRIDPFVQQAKLTASDGVNGDDFGHSVAISGSTVVVGAPRATVGTQQYQGAAYVFVEPASGWANATEAAKLTASDGITHDYLGYSVAISGNTVVAGMVGGVGGRQGPYVFVKPAGGWGSGTQPQHETAKLTASDGVAGDSLGSSVAIAGNTIVAGAPGATVGGNGQQGAAYVFVEPAGGWGSGTQPQHEAAKLTASDGVGGDELGASVAISSNTIVADGGGAAYVFVEPAGGWGSGTQPQHEAAKLTASDGAGFGGATSTVSISNASVAVSADGSTVVAGAPGATVGANFAQGAAYVFVEPAGGWASGTETAKLTASDGANNDELGASVAIASNAVVAGAPYATVGANFAQGAAYVFLEPASGWSSETGAAKLTATGSTVGWSVAMSGDTVAAGTAGIYDTFPPSNASSPGAAYVFGGAATQDPTSTVLSCSPGTVLPGQPVTCTTTVTDTGPSGQTTPTGPVSFSSDHPSNGTFSPYADCGLSGNGTSASCHVTYTPTTFTPATDTITATYGAYGTHTGSTASTTVTNRGEPLSAQSIQQVVFVHGVRADCETIGSTGQSYSGLYDALEAARIDVYSFCYDHDLAFTDFPRKSGLGPGRCFSDSSRGASGPLAYGVSRSSETSTPGWYHPLALTPVTQYPEPNDGDTALVYDAAKLDDCLHLLELWDIKTFGHPVPIAVAANSMGGAITRGWLQLAQARNSQPRIPGALHGVTTVVFLQGATQGSWLAGAGTGPLKPVANIPLPAVGSSLAQLADSQCSGPTVQWIGCLDPNRAGIQDLAPTSAWYWSIHKAGAPPHLHYYAFSTDLPTTVSVPFGPWNTTAGPYPVPGDGLMALGDGLYRSIPTFGGSQWQPFGSAADQHQYVIRHAYSVLLQAPLPPITGYALVTASLIMNKAHQTTPWPILSGDPASHFNFGDNIANVIVGACDGSGSRSAADEIVADLENPGNACSSGARSGSTAGSGSILPSRERRAADDTSVTQDRSTACATCSQTITLRHPLLTNGLEPVAFLDRTGQSQMLLYTRGPLRGRFILIVRHGTYVGTIAARLSTRRVIHLHITLRALQLSPSADRTVKIELKGTLSPGSHTAQVVVWIGQAKVQAELRTATANIRAAQATAQSATHALATNNLLALARLLEPAERGGLSASALAQQLASQHVHITDVTAHRPGTATMLSDGEPGWRQAITLRAARHRPLRTNLVFEQIANRWWLLAIG